MPEFLSLFPGKLKYFLLEWNENKLLFPIFLIKIKFYFLKLNKIICPTAPIILNGALSNQERFQIIKKFEKELSKKYNHKFFSVNQLPSIAPFFTIPISHFNKWRFSTSFSLIIDLSNEVQDIFHNLKKRTRYILRKATKLTDKELVSYDWHKKTKFIIKISENYQDLKYFYKYKQEIDEKIILDGSLPSNSLKKSTLDKRFITLSKLGLVKLFLIFNTKNEIGATALVFTIKKPLIHSLGYYSAGNSSEIGRKSGLPTVLQWFIITWLKINGFMYYDLGGISSKTNHGPSLFKKGFGGKLIKGWTLIKQSPIFYFLRYLYHTIKLKWFLFSIKLRRINILFSKK